ncbi:MAG: Gfo/Idh/MocA family oxidoreductase [Armatimonadetes bacterium]|nr:Gfo/Idh/MocA family oxidoreductase [Armatimonadota bacterium]
MSKVSRHASRRDLLKAGGAAAALAAVPGVAGVFTDKQPKKLRIGVVGGGFGTSFQWHEHPDCIVEAVSDLRPERKKALQDVYRCGKPYDSLELLIKDKSVEAVAVFTGAPDHVRHAVACLKAGKHVISAVPACCSVAEAEELLHWVKKTGLSYMMAETSYYHQSVISARKFYQAGKFGHIFYTEAEYQHAGMEPLWKNADGTPTWRHGFPPMRYPTHCTAYLVGLSRERLTSVMALGWGPEYDLWKPNQYKNPYMCETAMFKTDKGNAFRVNVFWYGAHRGGERGQWYGSDMSFFGPTTNGQGPVIVRRSGLKEKDAGGFERSLPEFEEYQQPMWWKTDMLPEPLRHDSGHEGSHTFLTHEFVDALVHGRPPAIDVYESLAITVPGIVAHESAMKGGKQMRVPQFDPVG